MFTKKQVSLLAVALASIAWGGMAAAVGTATSTMTVDATLTTACEVSATSGIHFGSFAALASVGDKFANSGSTFQVACSASATPKIYATGTRSMANGTFALPFKLSLSAGAPEVTDDLPATSGSSSALSLTQDGDLHDVVIYSEVDAVNFKSLPSGAYSTTVTMSVSY